MVKRNNHYEAAFEAYLRDSRVPYVAVDEAKRSLLADGDSVKSLDFIISPPAWTGRDQTQRFPKTIEACIANDRRASNKSPDSRQNDLVTFINYARVNKGFVSKLNANRQKAPSPVNWLVDVKGRRFPSGDRQKQYWKNWSTRDDLISLCRWEDLFGDQFGGLFVFAFNIVGDRSPLPASELFEFRQALYGFVAIRLSDYLGHARVISPRWDTVAMPSGAFRRLARPVGQFLSPA